jgi:hypothetical protein
MTEDIQKDFGITINGYPFIKKFSGKLEYSSDNFIEKFLLNTRHCDSVFRFKLDITNMKVTLISNALQRRSIQEINFVLNPNPKNEDFFKEYLLGYLSYQLTNSGVLESLKDVLLTNLPNKVIIIKLTGAKS